MDDSEEKKVHEAEAHDPLWEVILRCETCDTCIHMGDDIYMGHNRVFCNYACRDLHFDLRPKCLE